MLTRPYTGWLSPAHNRSGPTPLEAMRSTALIMSGHVYMSDSCHPLPVSYIKTPAESALRKEDRTDWIAVLFTELPPLVVDLPLSMLVVNPAVVDGVVVATADEVVFSVEGGVVIVTEVVDVEIDV